MANPKLNPPDSWPLAMTILIQELQGMAIPPHESGLEAPESVATQYC